MQKFKKKLIILGSLGVVIVGSLTYNFLTKSDIIENKENKKEMIAMYVQDEEGNYQMPSSKEFPKKGYFLNLEKSTCKNGSMLSQESDTKKVKVKLVHSDQCTLYFDKEVPKIEIGDITLKVQPTKVGVPDFTEVATTDETADGLFTMEDDYGTSYYFRGAVENNYVKFGKWTSELYRGYNSSKNSYDDYYSLEECQNSYTLNKNCEKSPLAEKDMYWRIIRFNGDGSVRMIYDGTSAHANGEASNDRYFKRKPWEDNSTGYGYDTKYVGWMFGGKKGEPSNSKESAQKNETDSDIKMIVDQWYKENIYNSKFHQYISDAIFCNDRTSYLGDLTTLGGGYSTKETYFGPAVRTMQNLKPQLKCLQDNDKFTVDTVNGGNGNLSYPVGLITVDETRIAGGKKIDKNAYLYKGSSYWTFSPHSTDSSGYQNIYYISATGSISATPTLTMNIATMPVINIKEEYLNQLQGTGTARDPFRLPEN